MLKPWVISPPEFDLDPDLQSFSPHLQFLQLNPTSLKEASEASRAFRERIHENQLQANERSIRQYGKQRAVKTFEVGESVSVAIPALDRASTDGKRIFGQVKRVHNGPSYEIQTKYGVLDRNFPTSELMPLPSAIDLEIPVPAPNRRITLHAVAARESTTDKVPVFCKCKDKRSCVVGAQLEGVLVSKLRLNVQLRVMGEMEMARLIVRILHLLLCAGKKDYGLGTLVGLAVAAQ